MAIVACVAESGELSTSPRRAEEMMPPKIARLVGLGAFGAIAGFVALFAYIMYLSWPSPTGGMMPGLTAVAFISGVIVLLGLVAAHVALGKQLLAVAEGSPREV